MTQRVVLEFLDDITAANSKYLAEDGNSKILKVTGTVAKISKDYNGNTVFLIKEIGDKAGVSTTFNVETEEIINSVIVGDQVTVKGIIRSGANYDKDLELYENVILGKCNLIY